MDEDLVGTSANLSDPAALCALSIDAAGTLLSPAESIGRVYARYARTRGGTREPSEVQAGFVDAMARFRDLRKGDPTWHRFWEAVVSTSTGVDDRQLVAQLRDHFVRPEAWSVAPRARETLQRARERGLKLALVSNWDERLRALLSELELLDLWDAVVISGEVGVEKPDPAIFALTCARLGVEAQDTLHVGDSDDDVQGARAAGLQVWWWGRDVSSFEDIAGRLFG